MKLNTEKVLVTVYKKSAFTSCILFGMGLVVKQLAIYTNAYKSWNNAFQLYQVGAYEACLQDYGEVYPVLKNNGDFLTNYGKALSMAEKHSEVVEILQQAAITYPNIVVFTALGDSYKNLKEPEKAEKAYLHAWYMNPSKFYPKYLLAKLYDETGQKVKEVEVAKELLKKEVKVHSTAIEEIKTEIENFVNNND